ncbi:MAG: amidohydrolase [Clostridia bacterium]|nr:amidohydrolase [Clostridia bacterium]
MLAIIGGTIYPVEAPVLNPGVILIENGQIVDIYAGNEVPAQAEVWSAEGLLIFPGFIDAHCHVGIAEEIYTNEGDDSNEMTDPCTPLLRVIDGIQPEDLAFEDALAGGVTTLAIAPGSGNVLGGQMAALKTWGHTLEERLVQSPLGIKAALGENPKVVYGRNKKFPSTRMASAAVLRKALVKAEDYGLCKQEALSNQNSFERDLNSEALLPVLEGRLPLRVHAHRADDILTAVRIAEEFKLKIVIEHGTEAYKVASILAEHQIPVVVGPIITNRAKVEMMNICLENARLLSEAGVKIAFMTDHPVVPIQYLALSAGLTVRGGLSEDQALEAITLGAARILGLDRQIGSLTKGKEADLSIWSGHPFDSRSRIKAVMVKGKMLEYGN